MTRDIKIVDFGNGKTGVWVCDETLKLILAGLKEMNISLPISEDDEDTIWHYLTELDAEIGGVEIDGIRPTTEYNERTGHAVDEFLARQEYDYLDYDEINRRLSEMMEKYGKDGVYELDYERWLPGVRKTCFDRTMENPLTVKLRFSHEDSTPYKVTLNFDSGRCWIWIKKGEKYRTATLNRSQRKVITKQITGSGLIGKENEQSKTNVDRVNELSIGGYGETYTYKWVSGDESVDEKFVRTIEKYLGIVPLKRNDL